MAVLPGMQRDYCITHHPQGSSSAPVAPLVPPAKPSSAEDGWSQLGRQCGPLGVMDGAARQDGAWDRHCGGKGPLSLQPQWGPALLVPSVLNQLGNGHGWRGRCHAEPQQSQGRSGAVLAPSGEAQGFGQGRSKPEWGVSLSRLWELNLPSRCPSSTEINHPVPVLLLSPYIHPLPPGVGGPVP